MRVKQNFISNLYKYEVISKNLSCSFFPRSQRASIRMTFKFENNEEKPLSQHLNEIKIDDKFKNKMIGVISSFIDKKQSVIKEALNICKSCEHKNSIYIWNHYSVLFFDIKLNSNVDFNKFKDDVVQSFANFVDSSETKLVCNF